MNKKSTKALWIGATTLVVAVVIIAFASGAGSSVNLSTPFMQGLVALLGLSTGIAAIIYTAVIAKTGLPHRQRSWWWLVFWALALSTTIISLTVARGSITLDLPTALVLVFAVILSSGVLWIQHGFVVSSRTGYPAKDERTERVQGKAALYTLYVSIGIIWGLLVYDLTYVGSYSLSELSGTAVLILLLVVIAVSYASLHWYLNRRGDA